MRTATVAAFWILILGVLGVGGFKLAKPWLERKHIFSTSDAKAGTTIRIGGDGYVGYFHITSPEMRREATRRGLAIAFTDDKGVYEERHQKFAKGEYDIIVLPVAEYVRHGQKVKYPGVIAAAIAGSKGADGIVAFEDKVPGGSVKALNNPNLRLVYTPNSPSSFLIDLTRTDFDLFSLGSRKENRVEVNGSEDVFARAKNKDGDVFVLWEPELSKALEKVPGLKYVWGSDKFAGYIEDVFVINRDFLSRKDDVTHFFEAYFAAMGHYNANREMLITDVSKQYGFSKDVAEKTLGKIEWYDLYDNARRMFGIQPSPDIPAVEGVAKTIEACLNVLLRTKQMSGDPFSGNPYMIINSSFIAEMVKSTPPEVGAKSAGPRDFSQLDESAWRQLGEVATLKVEPIGFDIGRPLLDEDGKAQVDRIAAQLQNNYAQYRIAVRGHTGPGSEEENRKLSMERAEVVRQYLIAVHGINPNRLHAEGWGDSQPPARRPDESERTYRYRMPRVEFVLVERGGS